MTGHSAGGAAYAAKPIVGYTDPLSVRPGDTLSVMVSTVADTFHASLVRMRHGDPHPDGPGLRYRTIPSDIEGIHPGRYQPLRLGSYVHVDHHPELEPSAAVTLQAWLYPTLPTRGLQGVITKTSPLQRDGYGLFLEPAGDLSMKIAGQTYRTGSPVRPAEWIFVAATYDSLTATVTIRQDPVRTYPGDSTRVQRTFSAVTAYRGSDAPLLLGAHLDDDGHPLGRYNGKIDSPRLYGRPLSEHELDALFLDADPTSVPGLNAAWDLGADSDSDAVPNRTGTKHAGRTVNLPTKAVTGRNWRGAETVFHRAPEQFNALYFHDDDLEDAHWEPSVQLTVPPDATSGIYAIRLQALQAEDWVPFFIRPAASQATADVVFLAPTLSYLAYANDHSAADNPAAAIDFDLRDFYQPEDLYAMSVPITGLYDHHSDGSGVCFSTWRRPVVNMRPHYHLPLTRSAHQLSADLHLIDWLEHSGVRYDVVTDHDLDADGSALLEPYRVMLTGSHPEYWTNDMLDALENYLARGGRVMYLGGNGLYWVTSISPSRPHLIEVRRGRRGTGTWRSAPGEDHHATTGELGGLWRDRGRAPQRLVTIGMAD